MTLLLGREVVVNPPPLPTALRGVPSPVPVTVERPGLPPVQAAPYPAEVLVLPVAGPPGAPGGPTGRYTHTQTEAAALWTVTHGLQGKPPVTLLTGDAPDEPVHTDVTYVDLNTLIVEWPTPVTGWAYL